MKKPILLLIFCVLLFSPALAADVSGDWQVEDNSAHIRIAICNGALWGIVGWEKSPGTDSENPDPAKRTRPTLGMPILINMKPVDGRSWSGQIYNAQNGKTYKATVTALSDNAIKVQGCVAWGLLCGGETWSRVPSSPSGRRVDFCSRISVPGATH
ncbi:DUF2147 domain-containing protein [Pseudorhodoplanes sp.]|uniref:DUF2147 domain-containing protein n=1 Tax=Pseudorhodoplanes sp. TaxID=1934341 RepID=UPI003D0B08D2